ncbi:MAG: 30S ribosome-binding factor RbfA [Eubacterium sp.]|nr:30S ribosome-binding factor RbfA [Eubacterium sp.]
MRGNNSRGARVNSDMQRVLSHVIQFEIKDPRVSKLVSVSKCQVTNDLKEAKCYISVLGNDEDGESTIKGLDSAKGFIRKRVAESLNMRYTPELHFILDKSIEYGVMMSKKIDDILANDSEKDQENSLDDSVDDEN